MPERLPSALRDHLCSPSNDILISPVNTWEVAIKAAFGKLRADVEEIEEAALEAGFRELPVRIAHTLRVAGLPPLHKDPFDRLLIAQAMVERCPIATRDSAFRHYEIDVLWD